MVVIMYWPYMPIPDPITMWYWMSWMVIAPMCYMMMYSLMLESYRMMMEFMRKMFEIPMPK
jgi:hypothetical protein